jgi:hypothetical protein
MAQRQIPSRMAGAPCHFAFVPVSDIAPPSREAGQT